MSIFQTSSPDLESLREALIMLIDDEPLIFQVIQAQLEEGGYKKFIATSRSVDAVDLIAEKRPDILLLDLMMPEMDGLQVLSRMRVENITDVPVIVLTSSKDPASKLKALELGASDFLGKPVDPTELLLRLGNTLSAKIQRDRLTNYDLLTGTPNRNFFTDRLEAALHRAYTYRHDGAVLHVGLDNFRHVNTDFGPRQGDLALRRIAQRLENCLRTTDTVVRLAEGPKASLSRFAGDEFDLLLPLVRQNDDAMRVAHRVLGAVAAPLPIAQRHIALTCSIGVAVFPGDGDTADLVLRNAAIAMQRAKDAGKNTVQFYSGDTQAPAPDA